MAISAAVISRRTILNNEVSKFLKNAAKKVENDFTMYDNLYGEIILDDVGEKLGANSKVHLSTGSVYGIFAIKTENSNIENLFKETNKLKDEVKPIDEEEKIYPVYWGKDINPGSRIVTHARPNPDTGNAKLEQFKELRNFKLIFGCIFISKYKDFEAYLHKNYPPLIGTSKGGKGSKITVIDN